MSNIWVISDTHLNHNNILDFRDDLGNKIRPFGSVSEMNERILTRWNDVVKPGDKVYHLGDVAFGSKEDFKELWPKFNGSKRLIVGNHDDIKFLSSGGFFKKVSMWRVWTNFGLIFTHVPIVVDKDHSEKRRVLFNIHGHIHQNPSPPGPYFNVSCEAVNYTPIHIEDLAKIAREYADTL
jgi:calcineurin-like phosphoesterase family protein